MNYQERSRVRINRRKRKIRNRRIVFSLILFTLVGTMVWVFIPKDSPQKKELVAEVIAPEYEKAAETPNITSPEPETEPEPTYTEDELFCMAAAIYNEAGGNSCSDETRTMVGYVILNRVKDERFPNTIREVLEAKKQYGRFYWTGVKFADRSSKPEEQAAVERAYTIAKKVLTEPSTIPETVVFQAEFEQGVGVYKYEDGIYFCYAKEVN